MDATTDQEVGRALRELLNALPPDSWLSVLWVPGPNGWRWEVAASESIPPPPIVTAVMGRGRSIVIACDSARKAMAVTSDPPSRLGPTA